MTPAKHFAINLGAPGDMKDNNGSVWFAYPNPKTESLSNHFPNYGVKFDLNDEILTDMGYFCSDFRNKTVEGSSNPWLFTSGCVGLTRCEVPLIEDMWGEKPGVYTVRLGFYASSSDRVGQRVFDIILQGEPVLKNFDIFKEAGIPNKAVIKEFKGIEVEDVLAIELCSRETNPTIDKAPLINFIEVIREDFDESLETEKPVSPITRNYAETLLHAAKMELSKKKYDKALERFHAVFDAAPTVNLKQQALEGMAAVGSPKSLYRIASFCRDTEPILWYYKEPNPMLKNSAIKVFVAVAINTAETDKQKAIKMLKHALTIANFESRKQVIASLKKLGAESHGDAGK